MENEDARQYAQGVTAMQQHTLLWGKIVPHAEGQTDL